MRTPRKPCVVRRKAESETPSQINFPVDGAFDIPPAVIDEAKVSQADLTRQEFVRTEYFTPVQIRILDTENLDAENIVVNDALGEIKTYIPPARIIKNPGKQKKPDKANKGVQAPGSSKAPGGGKSAADAGKKAPLVPKKKPMERYGWKKPWNEIFTHVYPSNLKAIATKYGEWTLELCANNFLKPSAAWVNFLTMFCATLARLGKEACMERPESDLYKWVQEIKAKEKQNG